MPTLRAQLLQNCSFLRVSWDQPVQTNLSGGLNLFTTGLPGSGPVLSFILNVLDDYNFSPASIADFNVTIVTYHRIIETFKYAFALRAHLGDGNFVDMTEVSMCDIQQFIVTDKIHDLSSCLFGSKAVSRAF